LHLLIPDLAVLPVGALERWPLVDICTIPRSEELVTAECNMDFVSVTVIDNTRPSISIAQVRIWLRDFFNIPSQCHRPSIPPKDFPITFKFYDDMLQVLHDPLPPATLFSLLFKRWRRQL
jgi:hypothetical protein